MRRRRLLPIATLAALVLALGACGGDDGGGTEEGDGQVTIFSLWGGSEQEAFQKVLTQFTKDTGIKTKYESARDFLPVIRTRLAADNPPEVAILPRPGFVDELAGDDALIPLEDLGLDVDAINGNYGQTWTDLATFEDTTYGVVAKANSKSTVWYKPNSFQENSFEIPTDWQGLLDITQQYKSKLPAGMAPWAVGAQGDDNSWTLTDWFEQIYARQAGPEKYRQLFETGDVPFNDQSVKDALTEMLKIVNDENVTGGIDTVLGISFVDAIGRVFGKNPKAELFYEGGFVGGIATGQVNTTLKPGEDIDFFEFPPFTAGENEGMVVGAGDVASAFVNNEDVAKLLEYLATPEAGKIWVSTGAIASPNEGVTDADYPNELVTKEAAQLKEAQTFLFDGSDLLPGTLGQNFGTLLQNVIKNPDQTDSLLDDYQAQAEQAGFGG
jgi:alpha-glucoside transport system substrate-binding protein